jgi:ribonuclease III
MDFSKFKETAGIDFNDKALLRQAFTHRSYLNENKAATQDNNERLEYFGDAVLGFVVADYSFKKFPDMDEAELTILRSALVNWNACAQMADKLNMNDFLLLSKGEAKDTGQARRYILANTFEAVIGAIYIDQGFEAARDFILRQIVPLTDALIKENTWMKNAKSFFQEQAQEHEGITPSYKTIKETGPDHDKHFVIGVYLNNDKIAEGAGQSKQDAEQEAATKALEAKGWEK